MTNKGDTHKYDDIINLPHHVSAVHPRMSVHDRAAQFSPFAALTGYGEAIKETARLTDARAERSESEISELNRSINLLKERMGERPPVEITYFRPDERKEGGAYLTIKGRVKKIKEYERLMLLENGTAIPLDDIYKIEFREEQR